MGGWGSGNAFLERIAKPVGKNGPPLSEAEQTGKKWILSNALSL